jgi:hypothetical protein
MNLQEFPLSKELNLKERQPNKEVNPGEIIVLQEIQIQQAIIMLQETAIEELNIPKFILKHGSFDRVFFLI